MYVLMISACGGQRTAIGVIPQMLVVQDRISQWGLGLIDWVRLVGW